MSRHKLSFQEKIALAHEARHHRAARRAGLSREQIAAAALAIADAQGFEEVTMRKVAAVLGTGTMTLYHYVRTKDDLVALMDDALMGDVLVPEHELPKHWRGALAAIARRTRAAFMRHPWALISMRKSPPGRNGMRHVEQSLAAVADTGLDPAGKLELIALVDDYVFGHVLRSPTLGERDLPPDMAENLARFAEAELASGAYPQLAALAVDGDVRAGMRAMFRAMSDEERFERGLEAVLDGAGLRLGLPKDPESAVRVA